MTENMPEEEREYMTKDMYCIEQTTEREKKKEREVGGGEDIERAKREEGD